MSFLAKIFRFIALALIVIILGGLGSLLFSTYLLPRLASSSSFARYAFLKQATEHTTLINKTEQILVREDDSVERIAAQASGTVTRILSLGPANISVVAAVPENRLTRSGTGTLVTNDGLIVTYRKTLIESNATYRVFLSNGSNHPATLLGIDNLTNLAYLKIEAGDTPAIAFADSDDTRPGKKLIALGSGTAEYQSRLATTLLNGFNQTFNLSEKTVASTEKWEGVFEANFPNQADYLGGPMIDFNGEMVGIVGSVLLDNREEYFLIPSNVVRTSLELAIRNTLDKRPVFGAYYVPITQVYAFSHSLERDRGALIYSPSGKTSLALISGSPAEKAGLRFGDIITAVDGQEINLDYPLSVALGNFSSGDQVELLIIREGAEKKVIVQL